MTEYENYKEVINQTIERDGDPTGALAKALKIAEEADKMNDIKLECIKSRDVEWEQIGVEKKKQWDSYEGYSPEPAPNDPIAHYDSAIYNLNEHLSKFRSEMLELRIEHMRRGHTLAQKVGIL